MTGLKILTATALLAVVFSTYPGAATAQDLYGSVAFSTEPEGGHAWGIAWDGDRQEGTRSTAVAACRDRGGSNCQEQVSFLNGCGALFIGGSNGWGIGTGASRLRAEATAREACESVNLNCRLAVSRCTSEPGTAAEIKSEAGGFAALYGAIAFSQEATGGYAWGVSWDHSSREAATSGALAACRAEGGAFCSERLTYRNGCGALVVGSPNLWVVARGESNDGAESKALETCQSSNADCQMAISQCTSPPGVPPSAAALAGSFRPPSAEPVTQVAVTEDSRQAEAQEKLQEQPREKPEGDSETATEPPAPQQREEPESPDPVQRGTLNYSDGSRYEGEHRDGKRHGRGTYTWADGNRYEGEWLEDKMHGQGTMTWHYGDRYEGEYREGRRHGRGAYIWADGRRFEGEWRIDEPVR